MSPPLLPTRPRQQCGCLRRCWGWLLVPPAPLVLGVRVSDSVLLVVSPLGVTTLSARSVSPCCSACWLGPGGGGFWLGSPRPGKGISYPLSHHVVPAGFFWLGPILHRHKSPPWPLFLPKRLLPTVSLGRERWGRAGSGATPAPATPACPEHPLPTRTARSRRVERLLTSHGSEPFPRTAAFCCHIFESLSWVRVSLPACPPCTTSA